VWARHGRELFFMRGDQLAVVAGDGQGDPIGRDRGLLRVRGVEDVEFDPGLPDYDVMPDGEHFVFQLGPQPSSPTYNVVLNWFEELKKKRSTR
jgi:hypothetical protein